MSSQPLVHFEGDWASPDRERVEAAIEEAELNGLPATTRGPDATWVIVLRTIGDTNCYLASRKRVEDVLRAPSASDLARRIREYEPQ